MFTQKIKREKLRLSLDNLIDFLLDMQEQLPVNIEIYKYSKLNTDIQPILQRLHSFYLSFL